VVLEAVVLPPEKHDKKGVKKKNIDGNIKQAMNKERIVPHKIEAKVNQRLRPVDIHNNGKPKLVKPNVLRKAEPKIILSNSGPVDIKNINKGRPIKPDSDKCRPKSGDLNDRKIENGKVMFGKTVGVGIVNLGKVEQVKKQIERPLPNPKIGAQKNCKIIDQQPRWK
jgi:hypothetical protein